MLVNIPYIWVFGIFEFWEGSNVMQLYKNKPENQHENGWKNPHVQEEIHFEMVNFELSGVFVLGGRHQVSNP